MQPTTRVVLGTICAVGSILVLVTVFSDSWYHAPYSYASYLPESDRIDWSGFGGPRGSSDQPGWADVLGVPTGIMLLLGIPCALVAGFGAIAGARRNHVPRLPALLAAAFVTWSVPAQALLLTTWPYDKQLDPHGFGWAMPVFFVSAIALAGSATYLWIDARKRARASAEQLAAIEREQTAADLAAFPELAAEVADPIERL